MNRISSAVILANVAALTLVVFLCACSETPAPPPEPTTEEADSAGIRIVNNLEADKPLAWTFTPVFSVGNEAEDGFSFFRRSAAADENGNIYVLDGGNHRVMVFGPTGRHMTSFGRQGGGPGEFSIPVGITVLPEGEVSVYDIAKHGFVNFAPDGTLLPEKRVEEMYTGGRLARSPQILAITSLENGPTPGVLFERILDVGGTAAREITRLEKAGPQPTTLPGCGITIADLPPLFQPSLIWALRDTLVLASRSDRYVIDAVTPGGMSGSYRRPTQPRAATLEMATAEVGDDMRFGPHVCTAADIAESVGFAPTIPVIAAIQVAPDGTIWVKRHTGADEPAIIDILDGEGTYLGTLPHGSPFPAAFLPDSRIVVEEVDDQEVEMVVVYEVHLEERDSA